MPGTHSTNRLILPVPALVACVALGVFALAQDKKPVTPKLTPKLQDLLRKEMLSFDAMRANNFSPT